METDNQEPDRTPDTVDGEYWLDKPANINRIYWALIGVCAFLVVVLIMIAPFIDRHVEFGLEKFPGFYGAFGFVAFVCIVMAGKYLRKLLMREEDYYDR